MLQDNSIFLGAAPSADGTLLPQYLGLKYANRHGLVTGATGTGKTVTLQILAEGFSAAGVPVFAADVKGDLSGIGAVGRAEGLSPEARRGDRLRRRISAGRNSDAVLGSFRRAGPSDPHHGLRDGAAAPVAADGAQRDAGGRAQHRLQDCRRGGPAAPRPEGPAGDADGAGRARRRDLGDVRQRHEAVDRRDPAAAPGPGGAGRRSPSSASRRSTSPT